MATVSRRSCRGAESGRTRSRQPLAVSPWRLHFAVHPSGLTWTTSRRAQNVQ
ncbi:Uncharacterised protein [Amycolatopsis camponoti]|uniref:Uncharacterized protein n=1 Tax=Amycolatopsis camponoti TaxID=2606593 RepID=A0A6I8LM43_9PSEU|nr:Uncharacterised protein [Amycolatopsis camponoti]